MTPALHLSDGGVRKMAWYVSPNINDPDTFDVAISSDFWRLNRDTRVLSIPNGDTCQYQVDPLDQYNLLVDECTDTFGNEVDFTWDMSANPPQLQVTQKLSATLSRQVNIALVSAVARHWDSLTYDERSWDYGYEPNLTMTTVSPPVGPGWTFAYDGWELVNLETPRGGIISFTYDSQFYLGPDSPQTSYWTRVLKTRATSGNGIEPGTWTYSYDITVSGISGNTTVETPTGRVLYQHGWNESPLAVFDGEAGILPLASRIVQHEVDNEWVDLEKEERTYKLISVLSWWTFGTLELETRTITRYDATQAPTEYETTFTYDVNDFGDYHHPHLITEVGPAGTRSTVREFEHHSAPYQVGLPTEEEVTVSAVTFTKSWTYASTGFKTSETVYGITTEFGADGFGNVQTVTKANGKQTVFAYQHGRIRTIWTPEHTVTRVVNPDGSIASETQAGRTTTFTYDDLGRLTLTQPAGGTNPTLIEYDNVDGEWVRTTRGTSQLTTTLDGFGRPIRTINALGVETRKEYDEEGRVVYEGYPFNDEAPSANVDVGTDIQYDALGRVTKRVNPDGSFSEHEYLAGGAVRIRDEALRETLLTWQGFGDPDEQRLAGIVDADGKTWSYTYTPLGRLKGVTAQDGTTRTWVFDQRNLLTSETHPESGTTTYPNYDAAGMLIEKVDANGTHTFYAYDGNDRVTTITAGNRVTAITYEPGSDNRQSATNTFAGILWTYDTATGRLLRRRDTIGLKSFTTMFEYDNSDHVRAIVYPSGRRVQYDVNAEGQPTRVFEAAAGRDYAASISYHPSGGVASYASGNGVTTTIEYDPLRYWVDRIAAGTTFELTYDYDLVGNPHTIGDSRQGYSQALSYDNLDRLTGSAMGQYVTTFSYNLHGNRTGPSYQFDSSTLRLSSQDGTLFTYDNNGNTVTAGGATFTYTPFNQVETANNLGTAANYAYDADDQRVRKETGGSTIYYVRGAAGELLTEWKDPGTSSGRIRDYIYLGTRLVSAVARDSAEDPAGYNTPPSVSHRYATSWQVPDGSGGSAGARIQFGASAAARKSMHPDMPATGLRLGVQTAGNVDYIVTGPLFIGNNPAETKQGGVFLEFEVERYPFSADAEWLGTDGGGYLSSSTDDLRLYITSSGQLVLKHHGGRATPLTLWTSEPVGLRTPHRLEVRFEYNSYEGNYPLPNPAWENLTSWAQVLFDGQVVASYGAAPGGTWSSEESQPTALDLRNGTGWLVSTKLKSPGPSNGLLMNVWRAGATAAQNPGGTLGVYGSAWRTTLLQAAAAGTYTEWTGGQPDWRARSIIAGQNGFTNPATTTIAGLKLSYRMESMLSRGITGDIATVLIGVRMQYFSPNTRVFISRNGVETILTDMTLGATDNRWYRVANAGWSPTDVVEIGVTSGDNASNYLNAVALLVEHNTPEPAPLTDTSARVMTYNYVGNGGAQTIDFGIDSLPTAVIAVAIDGPAGTEPIWWWESRQGAAGMAQSVTSFARIWPQRGNLHVVHTPSDSYNANGVSYFVVALFDPSGRYAIPFAVSKPATDDDYAHELRYPQSGEPATDFTPDFVFGGAAFGISSNTAAASFYKGPGHAGDATAKLGVAQLPDADRIQEMGPGIVEFGTLIGHQSGGGDYAFWAGRVDDGVSPTRLMAVASYVGDGTASRNIAVNLSGESPVLAFVVPVNAAAKVYRVGGDTTGRNTTAANPVTNSITAMAADQITVGLTLNAVGVTYDVWAITTGTVTP